MAPLAPLRLRFGVVIVLAVVHETPSLPVVET
jgi:hypothetical protein